MEIEALETEKAEEPAVHAATQENLTDKSEDATSDDYKLDIKEPSSKSEETTQKSKINEEGDCMKVDNQNIAEDVDIQARDNSTTTENLEHKDEIRTVEQVTETSNLEVADSVTQENKIKDDNQKNQNSLTEEKAKSEDIVMESDPLKSPHTAQTYSKPEIKILSCEIIKPPLNPSKSCVVSNSLGLSLVASEYASTEESEEDSSSSDENDDDDSEDEDEESNFDSDGSFGSALSKQSIPRKAADSLDAIANEIELVTNLQEYRNQVVEVDSDTGTSDSSDVEIISQAPQIPETIELDDEDEDGDGDGRKSRKGKRPNGPLRVKGELLLDDLPPIEDLHITVPENECEEFGKIHSVVDQLVLVEAKPEAILLDLDTVLFLEKGNKVLGKVFDVLGQVASPLYCIRFNSHKQIKEKCIEIGQTVYVAPKTEHTQFLILTKLVSLRGSDASWENDLEPPPSHLEYSDDEQERSARKALRNRHNEEGAKRDDDEESSVQDDAESIQSDSTMSSQRSRKRRFNQPRRPYGHHPASQQNQGYNNYSPQYGYNQSSPASGYNQNYHSPSGYNSRFNRNPPAPGAPFYNSAHNSWHSNFNPYNQYNNGNYPSYPNAAMPPPPGHMQQPLYPPNQGGFQQPPPPWNNQ